MLVLNLGDSQHFVALDQDASHVFAIVATDTYQTTSQTSDYWLQTINVSSRHIDTVSVHKLSAAPVLALRHDAYVTRAWVATSPPGSGAWDPAPGFDLSLLAY